MGGTRLGFQVVTVTLTFKYKICISSYYLCSENNVRLDTRCAIILSEFGYVTSHPMNIITFPFELLKLS